MATVEPFGRWLTRERELRGMTRAEVAGLTKLSPLAVDALEEDRFDALPGRAFVVGYIRTYALAVGMNADEAVLRFEEWAQAHPELAPPEPPGPVARPRPRRWPAVAAAVAAAIALVLLLWWAS